MTYTYDPQADALYVALGTGEFGRTIAVDEDRNVDLDATGGALGIEVIGASEGFQLTDLVDRFGLQRYTSALQDIQARRFQKAPHPGSARI